MDAVKTASCYLNDNPPVGTVYLSDCPAVQFNPANMPSFKGTYFPVVALFDFLKARRTCLRSKAHISPSWPCSIS